MLKTKKIHRRKKILFINRINIKNFRQYKNVSLTFDSPKGIYLFIGKNGMGKSNFLNAICWCLYGKQPFKFHDKEKRLLNEEASKVFKFDEVKVSIEVNIDNKLFLFQRSQIQTGIADAEFIVMSKQGEDWKPFDNPTVIVNNFLPESISQFFLFDGEAVQNLYKGDYSEKLRDGVWKVSDVTLLDRASKDLSGTKNQVQRLVSKDEPDTELLDTQLRELEKNKEEKLKLLESLQKNILESKEKREKFSDELKRFSAIKNLQEQRDMLRRELEEATSRSKTYQEQINNKLISIGPFWYIKDNLVELAQKLTQVSTSGQLPPKIKSTFLQEIIDRKKCICGTTIIDGSTESKCLHKLLVEVEPLDSRSYLIEDKIEINSMIKDLQTGFQTEFSEIRERLAEERKRIGKKEMQLKEISEKLLKEPGHVGDIESTIRRLDEQIDSSTQNIGATNSEMKQLDQNIIEHKNKLEKLNKERGKRKTEIKYFEFLEEAKDKIDYIREKLIVQVGKSVSNYTNEYFKELVWKKEEFEKVSFTEDFKVEVFKKGENLNSLEILSTGEMKILSFATLKALAKLSGFNSVPIFIDGPLENLDKEVRANFLEKLPNFIEDKQVFIFSLDSDLIENFGKKHAQNRNFYRLTRDGDSLSTTIKLYE